MRENNGAIVRQSARAVKAILKQTVVKSRLHSNPVRQIIPEWFLALNVKRKGLPGPGSIYGQAVERCSRQPTSNIGSDRHFKNGDIREFDAIFFDLGYRMGWAEIPLLAHYLSQRALPV